MKSALAPLAAVASLVLGGVLIAAPAPAHAGYLTLGVGTGASLDGTIDNYFSSEDHNSGRLVLGQRFGVFSLEAGLSGYGLTGINSTALAGDDWKALNLSAAGKLAIPLVGSLEGYVRGGLQRSWLTGGNDDAPTYSGTGWLAGAGLEYRMEFLIADASIWGDYTHDDVSVDADTSQLDGSAGTFMVGLSVGL